ncbi:nickel-dependent lactate racemase [Ruminococcaceae bacterium OttesenSCG-928-A16]|nr:nickel-dependent lactate racemase [Ruminococcaceae bacterium OttesenSCG-928-A16]
MQQFNFNYGSQTVALNLGGAAQVQTLAGYPPADITDIQAALYAGLEHEMVNSSPLRQLVNQQDEVTIVISDLTRLWQRQDLICTALVNYLLDTLGLPPQNVVVLVALGTHRPMQPAELAKVAGNAYNRVQVLNHNCEAETAKVGTTSFGTEVKVNPLLVGRKVILVGGTVHHLMSGYGGGRKSIVPGVAAKSTVVQNHLRCLDERQPHSSSLIGPGKLADNPVHLDMTEAAAFVNPVFGINAIPGQNGPSGLVCGHWLGAWLTSCKLVNQYFGVPIAQKADIVIASCGGYPKDLNLYQAVKTLLNAGQAVKPGGTIVWLAQCEEGGGAPDFFDWIQPLRAGRLDAALREDFSIAGYIFYASIEVIRRCGRVLLLTQIPAAELDGMGIEVFNTVQGLQQALQCTGKQVYIMPTGGNTVPYVSAK